jgi:hypothetical protein
MSNSERDKYNDSSDNVANENDKSNQLHRIVKAPKRFEPPPQKLKTSVKVARQNESNCF